MVVALSPASARSETSWRRYSESFGSGPSLMPSPLQRLEAAGNGFDVRYLLSP